MNHNSTFLKDLFRVNFPVTENRSLIVSKDLAIQRAEYGKIWTDTSGHCHKN